MLLTEEIEVIEYCLLHLVLLKVVFQLSVCQYLDSQGLVGSKERSVALSACCSQLTLRVSSVLSPFP